jgi:hypothetical protein
MKEEFLTSRLQLSEAGLFPAPISGFSPTYKHTPYGLK